MTQITLRHGIFLPPFHPMEENPTACLDRDLELMVWLDRLGFHEAWIGEHHSAGFETISSPEIFIAIAAERTKFIRLGTGVISLPYHNPLMVADRIVQLDHHTRGRVMFGAGPGLLASDAYRRDPREGVSERSVRLRALLELPQQQPAPLCRPRRAGPARMVRRKQIWRGRDGGRRDRADRTAAVETGPVWGLFAAGPQLGRFGRDQALL